MSTKNLLQCYNPHLTALNDIFDNTRGKTGKSHELNCSNNDHLITIKVEGLITTIAFHKARFYAQKLSLHLSHKYAVPRIREMLQVDWYEYLKKLRVRIGCKMWILKRHVAVFINDVFIGSDIEFLDYINELYVFHMQDNVEYYEKLVKEYYKEFLGKTKRIYVYFTCNLDGSIIGSLLFMLYSDLLPHTCKHFLNLCTGKYENVKGFATSHYLNTSVHRIVKNGWIQLGDSISSEMTGIPTIPDESYCIAHNRRGVLSMANNGKHSNESEFIVSLKSNAWMDYHYVAFGQLIDGIHVLQEIEDIPTYYEHPLKRVVISQCGEYILDQEPQMKAETDIFLERSPWVDVYGESVDVVHQYPFNTYSDISVWLDNIVDEVDIRDRASLFTVERYLSGLYCLSTHYLSEMNVQHIEKHHELDGKINITCDLTLCELLKNFQPDKMNKEERKIFIEKLCKIIISYALNSNNSECCAQHISKHSYGTVHKILEYAYDIARAIIAKSLNKHFSIADTKSKINNLLKTEQYDDGTKEDRSLSLIEEILNRSLLYSLRSTNKVDSE